MDFYGELPFLLFGGAVAIGVASVGRTVARRKGRSGWGWFVGCLVGGIVALVVLLALPRRGLSCPSCGAPYHLGQQRCGRCQVELPDRYESELASANGKSYPLQCPSCGTPYRLEDYRADAAEMRCGRCKAVLPRTPPTESRAPSPPHAD